jgi:hypothetical protein
VKYPFVYTDGGRSESRRPRQASDCTVIALAVAADLPYDEAYDILKDAGRKSHRGFNFRAWADNQIVRDWFFEWVSFPAVKGQRRMNPVRFCCEFPKGRYIARVAKHVVAVVDGTMYATFPERDDRCIYGVWALTSVADAERELGMTLPATRGW